MRRHFDWRPLTFLASSVTRGDGRALFLYVADGGKKWLALAVEGPSDGPPIAILDDHAHQLVGEFANPPAAQRAAEGFAKKWLRGARSRACECKDVKTPSRRRRVR